MSLPSPSALGGSLDLVVSPVSYQNHDYPTPTIVDDSAIQRSLSDSPSGISAQDDSAARPPSRLLPPGASYAPVAPSPTEEPPRPPLPSPRPPLPTPPTAASPPPFLRTDSTTSSASPALPLQFSLIPPSLAAPPQPSSASPPQSPPNSRTPLPSTSLPYQRMDGPYPQPPSKGKQREEDSPRERDSMVGVGRDSILRASMELLGPSPAPPHLVLQPEVCVECMMRDRDMIDVDVTGEGAWSRESDQDWEEAVRWDEEGSEESARRSREVGSRESRGSYAGRGKRIGKGQPLTVASLKLWTSMNPPASAHRWRTLQGFLATQIHLLELERQAREANAAERDRVGVRQSAPALLSLNNRSRSSTLLPNGLVVEIIHVERDDKRSRTKSRSRDDGRRDSHASFFPPPPPSNAGYSPSPAASVRSYAFGDQPWLSTQARRFSSPQLKNGSPQSPSSKSFGFGQFARSSTDLRTIPSPRSISPGRASLGVDNRRHSVWSRFRQSASQSVLSFAPSGSMMDMHLGLSMDKHAQYAPYETYPSMSDPVVARHVEADRERSAKGTLEKKKKKKGIKGFFSKLIGGEGKKGHGGSSSEPGTPGRMVYEDDADLRPPPPLSALANEPRYHLRSQSNSSIDSFQQPPTPQSYHQPFSSPSPSPYPSHPRANSVPLGSPSHFPPSHPCPASHERAYPPSHHPPSHESLARAGPADRGSILTMGSFASTRSNGIPGVRNGSGSGPSGGGGGGEYSPPRGSFLSSSPPYKGSFELERTAARRKEKSLPPLPPEAESTSFKGREEEEVGGGRKSKARSKAWSIGFGAGGRRRESEEGVGVREEVLEGVRREGLVSVRY